MARLRVAAGANPLHPEEVLACLAWRLTLPLGAALVTETDHGDLHPTELHKARADSSLSPPTPGRNRSGWVVARATAPWAAATRGRNRLKCGEKRRIETGGDGRLVFDPD